MASKFKYIDKLFSLTTVNRQNSFYYKITKPIEVWGNYHTQIAFYDRQNNLVYHRQGCFAHVMQSDIFFGFVKWSKTGNLALFYEFRRGPVPGDGIYDFIIILLDEKVVHRIELNKHNHAFFDNLEDNLFDDIQIMEHLLLLNINGEECYNDPVSINPILWLTGVDKWQPFNRL
jgi:hypothetical protein